ncbi:DUF1285 domain-containing protein [Larsenimonas suaedae]|uniref:DUF1285 domain-containing protein n=1 Tax=Larsenimonas suaedae TaxID=1851019 RepID=A0ABU1GVI8_9GAMM|nr:DUF1285 domain-containing protein [Larsenimonas suaedae]MCM2971131.1 DUF1285 domain-containing protein [Larsenimonas suaedae]MDR5895840.1 DUF1285 domain-containing protein [Larsenimonas suaedae]
MLQRIIAHLDGHPPDSIPPLMAWDPPFCGDMPLEIDHDGQWWHEGALITRERLRRLLATLMRREDDGHYYLVTPAEKLRIKVEDTPFVIIDVEPIEAGWVLISDVGDRIPLDGEHPLRLDGDDTPPRVDVRFGLTARLHRNVFYRWVESGDTRESDGVLEVGVESQGHWHVLGRMTSAS